MNPSPPIPIAFCITELDPGGAERALVRLVLGLDRTRWSPRVYCLGPPAPLVEPLQQQQIPVDCLCASSARDLSVLPRLLFALRQQRPRLLQTFLFHANVLGRLAGHWAGVSRIVSGIRVAERRSPWYLRLDRWTERWVDRHVCVSAAVAQHAQQTAGLNPQKLVVIPNGVDEARFRLATPADLSQFGIPAGAFTFLSIGRLDPQKGVLDLLEAFRIVAANSSNTHLLLVGEGSERLRIEDWISTHGLGSRVHLAGFVDDVAPILKAAQRFVLASRWEGMPNVLLEAMAAELPLITTQVEGIDELIQPGRSGWVVPPAAPLQLASAMQASMQDEVAANHFAAAAAQTCRSLFSWEKMVQSYEQLYLELLHNQQR